MAVDIRVGFFNHYKPHDWQLVYPDVTIRFVTSYI